MALVKSAMALSKLNALRCAAPRAKYVVELLGFGFNQVGVIRDRAVNLLRLDPIRPVLRRGLPKCQRKRKTPRHSGVHHLRKLAGRSLSS